MRRIRIMGLCIVVVFVMGMVAAASAAAYEVTAWGSNFYGELGNGTTATSEEPVAVSLNLPHGVTVKAVSAGAFHSVALLSNGKVMAWGDNSDGQLGNGNTTNSDVPVTVCEVNRTSCTPTSHALTKVTAISAGYYYNLALLSTGEVVAWGENSHGQLGNGDTNPSHMPVAVSLTPPSGVTVTAVSAGLWASLARLSNGTVMGWGENSHMPVTVCAVNETSCTPTSNELTNVTRISSGEQHSLALQNGTVAARGVPSLGVLGTGSPSTTSGEVCEVEAMGPYPCSASTDNLLTGVTAVFAGWQDSLALHDGTVATWGFNQFGELGNDTTATSEEPVAVCAVEATAPCAHNGNLLTNVTAISAGEYHSLALLSTGEVVAWGFNSYDQLGNDTQSNSYVPVAVCAVGATAPCAHNGNVLTGVTAISANYDHSLALSAPPSPLPPPEFEGPTFPKEFTSKEGPSVFETTTGLKIKCASDKDEGAVTGPTTITETIIFKNCELGTSKCYKPLTSSPPETVQLEGLVGFTNKTIPEVGLELKPPGAAKVLIEFECPAFPLKIKVEGSVVGVFEPLNVFGSNFTVTFAQVSGQPGYQKLRQLEDKPVDVPECKIGTLTSHECGFKSEDEITFTSPKNNTGTTLIP